MHKRLLIILTTITLSTALLVGCGNKQEEIPQATTEEIAPEQTEEETTPPTEIAEPTPEATAEPVEEATTEPETTEPMETVEPEPTEEPTPELEPQVTYTYTDMSATMYAQQTVNVRDLPDTSGNKVGSLSANDEIAITGKCNETGWYRFDYNGNVAYVSNKYVGDEKVEVAPPASNNSGSGSANSGSVASNWADSYPKNQWIDMGEYFFYIANSQPEANQVSCDYFSNHTTGDDAHLYHTDLNARYPDRRLYTAAFPTEKGNVPIAIVSTYINEPWYCPKFIWE